MQKIANLGYLIHHLSFALDRQSDELLQERFAIGFSQFKILMALKWHTDVRQRQIAEYLGQTEASISRQIGLMSERGLLQSRVRSDNRREHVVSLTSDGEKLATDAMKALNAYHNPMFARLSIEQQQALHEILNTMHEEVCQEDKAGACNPTS